MGSIWIVHGPFKRDEKNRSVSIASSRKNKILAIKEAVGEDVNMITNKISRQLDDGDVFEVNGKLYHLEKISNLFSTEFNGRSEPKECDIFTIKKD